MPTWKVGDATIESGGKVTGTGVNADDIRRALESGAASFYPEAPPGSYPVDPKNDWTLHRYLLEYAAYNRVEMTTDYVPKDEDIPPKVAELIAMLAANPREDGMIY
jgi:hypothetical protein